MDYVIVHGQLCRSDELYHHGVLGMKWGVRRYQNKNGSLTAAGKKRRSLGETIKDYRTNKKRKASLEKARQTKAANKKAAEDRAKALAKGKIKAKNMTDEELKAKIARMELEKSYHELVSKTDKSASTRGKRFVDKFLDSSIEKIADNAAADIVAQSVKVFTSKGANKVLNNILKTEGSEYVFANNKKK